MAKYKFYCNTGYVGSEREEIVDIPDDYFEGMTEEQKEKELEDIWWQFMSNNCDWGWYPIDEGDED